MRKEEKNDLESCESPQHSLEGHGGVGQHSAPYGRVLLNIQSRYCEAMALLERVVYQPGDTRAVDDARRFMAREADAFMSNMRAFLDASESAKSVPHASVSGETQTADPQDSKEEGS